jgi:Flp pilus assembly protein TadG
VTVAGRAGRRREGGEVTTQLVILTPVVLGLLLAIVQLSLWIHSAHVATAAAAEAVSVASRRDGSAGAGAVAASTVVAEAGSRLAGAPLVARSNTWSTAEVHVGVPRVLPGFPDRVARRAAGPVERFVPETRP